MKRGCLVSIIVGAVLLVLVLIIGGWLKATYNGLVNADEAVKTAWSQVENQFQRRFDLIPNLVETVKGYASHERETLTAVTEARAKVGGARTVDEKMQSNGELSSALSRLMVVVEQYPNLKADQSFIRLQDELSGTENRLAVERRKYNETALTYNVKIRSFPTILLAGIFHFERAKLFESAQGADQAPKVNFSK
jgi:LemA protein